MGSASSKLREILKFLSGFQVAHIIAHIALEFSDALPFMINLGLFKINFTENFNNWAIFYNVLILAVLVYFAYFEKNQKRKL